MNPLRMSPGPGKAMLAVLIVAFVGISVAIALRSATLAVALGAAAAGVVVLTDVTGRKRIAAREATERRRAEAALEESEARLRAVIDTCGDAIFLFDQSGRIRQANPAAVEMHGYSMDELTAMKGSDLVDRPSVQEAASQLARLKDGERVTFEVAHRRKDGSSFPVEVVATPLRLGDEPYVLSFDRDISDRRRTESLLREAEKFAATGRMAARIAHEINNPLGGIRNALWLIKDSIVPTSGNVRWLGMIDREIDRIARIIRQMFEMYGSEPEKPRDLLYEQSISEVVELMRGAAAHRQVTLVVESVPESIPGRQSSGFLSQVLYNLLSNAIDASPANGTVFTRLSCHDDWVIVEVEDQGAGIAAGIRGKIFEPFFSTKTGQVGSGMGLGLPVARGLAESMGGTLDLVDSTKVGIIFRLRVPRVAPIGNDSRDSMSSQTLSETLSDGKRKERAAPPGEGE